MCIIVCFQINVDGFLSFSDRAEYKPQHMGANEQFIGTDWPLIAPLYYQAATLDNNIAITLGSKVYYRKLERTPSSSSTVGDELDDIAVNITSAFVGVKSATLNFALVVTWDTVTDADQVGKPCTTGGSPNCKVR